MARRRRGPTLLLCAALTWTTIQPAVAQQAAPSGSLAEALRRERALLRAELDAIERAEETAKERAASERAEIKQDLERARARYREAAAAALKAEREISALDARSLAEPDTDAGDALGALTRLERALDLEGGAEELDEVARLDRVAARAPARIISAARVTRAQAPFFLPDGAQTEGLIVRVGAVAAAGVDDAQRGGPLVPLGVGGAWTVVEPGGAGVRAYLSGESERAPLLVFDPRDPPDPARLVRDAAEQEAPERTWRDTVEDGAPVGHVILALGALALLVFCARCAALAIMTVRERRLGKLLLSLMHHHDEEGHEHEHDEGERLERLRDTARARQGALSRVTLQALSHMQLPLALYESSVQATLIVELGRIGRGLSALRAIAAVAPLLGLLGTVIGMTSTFETLTVAGSAGDPQALSGGIAQALATTQIGLIVAVPALLLFSALRGWANQMENYIEHIAVELSTHVRELALSRALELDEEAPG